MSSTAYRKTRASKSRSAIRSMFEKKIKIFAPHRTGRAVSTQKEGTRNNVTVMSKSGMIGEVQKSKHGGVSKKEEDHAERKTAPTGENVGAPKRKGVASLRNQIRGKRQQSKKAHRRELTWGNATHVR